MTPAPSRNNAGKRGPKSVQLKARVLELEQERTQVAKALRALAYQCVCRNCEHTSQRQDSVEKFLRGEVVSMGGYTFNEPQP